MKLNCTLKHIAVRGEKGFREALVDGFPFIVVYKIDNIKKEIFISSVHHAKRHPKNKYR